MAETIKIGGELESTATGNVVAAASAIKDKAKGKYQSQINAETDDTLAEHGAGIRALNSQNYVTVSDYASLPQSGQSADTVYRVSNYDGALSAVDSTKYSEYAWNGAQYLLLSVKSAIEEVFDVSEYNASGGSYATYTDLADLLANHLADIPPARRKGGMSVKFIQTSDNKYVQFRYMGTSTANADFTNVDNWQGVDDEPTSGSENLVKSGGVAEKLGILVSYKHYPYNTVLFTSDDVSEGDTVFFTISNAKPDSGYYANAGIGFFDSNNTRLGIPISIDAATDIVVRKRSVVIPENFAYCAVLGWSFGIYVGVDTEYTNKMLLDKIEKNISDINVNAEKIDNNTSNINDNRYMLYKMIGDWSVLSPTFTANKKVLPYAIISDNSSYQISAPIQLNKGDFLCVTTFGNNFAPICQCDSNGNILKVLAKYEPTLSFTDDYYYLANDSMYVIVCTYAGRDDTKVALCNDYSSIPYLLPDMRNKVEFTYELAVNHDELLNTGKTLTFEQYHYPTSYTSFDLPLKAGDTIYYTSWSELDKFASIGPQLSGLKADGTYSELLWAWSHRTSHKIDILEDYVDVQIKVRGGNTGENGQIKFTVKRQCWKSDVDTSMQAVESLSEYVNENTLPAYYDDYLAKKQQQIRNIQRGIDGIEDSFVFITDTHWMYNNKKSPMIIEELLKAGLTHKVIFGGDLMHVTSIDADAPLEKALKQVDFHRAFVSSIEKYGRFYNVRGNHDVNTTLKESSEDTGSYWVMPTATIQNMMLDPMREWERIKNLRSDAYDYVFDNDAKKIRYIVIATTTLTSNISWLITQLNSTPSGYDIVVFNHYGALLSTTGSAADITPPVEHLDDLLSAVNKRQSGTILSTSYDFTSADYNVIAYIAGHTHKNLQSFSNGVVHITTTCDAQYPEKPYMGEDDYSTTVGTINEQRFDFIEIDKANDIIYAVRIGGGGDRIFNRSVKTVAVNGTVTLTSVLSGTLTWGAYDNNAVAVKNTSMPAPTKVSISGGVVTGIATGEAVVYAKDENGNREFFDIVVS